MAITGKEINLGQLDKELGSQGLSANFNDPKKKIIVTSDNSTVTEEELNEAIENHIAEPTEQQIQILNFEAGVAKLKELGFTDAQIKALTGR